MSFIAFQLHNQSKLDGLILINASISRAGWIEWAYQKVNINLLWRGKMWNFTVNYLLCHHLGKHLDEFDPVGMP